jgi:uncharacterized protein
VFDHIARLLLRFQWPLLALVVLATVLLGWQAAQVRFDFSPRSIFLTSDEEVGFLDEHRQVFGDEDGIVVVLVEAEDVFQPHVLEQVVAISDAFDDLEDIDKVLSLTTMPELSGSPPLLEIKPLLEEIPTTAAEIADLRERTLSSRVFLHRFVNPEGTATAILGIFDLEVVEELDRRPTLAAIEDFLVRNPVEGVSSVVLGVPVVNREYAVRLQQDMTRAIGLSIILICFVLFFLFRNAYSVALPMSAVGVCVVWTVGYMVLAGDSFNIINVIVPTLLLVIGIGDAVHFLTTYYQERGTGTEHEQSIHRMVQRIGAACLLTSVTASIGFASLIVARIDIIKGMGRVAAAGLMIAYLLILILVPTTLSKIKPPKSVVIRDPSTGLLGRLLVWLGDVVTRHKAPVIAVTAVVCILAVVGSFRVESDSFLLEELFKKNPVSQALHHSEDVLTGVMPVEISIKVDTEGGVLEPEVLRGMVALQEHMADDPFIGHSVSIADLILEIADVTRGVADIPETRRDAAQLLVYFEMSEDPSFLDSMVDVNRSTARISTTLRDWGTDNFFAWYDGTGVCDARAKCGTPMLELIDQSFGTTDGKREGLEVRVTGAALVSARALSRLVEDMVWSLLTAFLVISLLMMVLLRSLRIGLLSMIPNVIPLLVTLGFMGWVGIPLRTSTALIFSISLGVAVNDTIHFVTRFREELFRTGDRGEAVRLTMLSTGRAIMFTSILLIAGFGTMLTTRFVGIMQMGILGAVTLSAALLGDLLLLPVCLGIFRPWSRHVEKKKQTGTWKPVELGEKPE